MESFFLRRVPRPRLVMQRRPQALDLKRRAPRQDRALDTVDTIFEAAARILQSEGKDSFNTNHIAERAGISIGTLYQYFPNKKAILVALARRESERVRKAVFQALTTSDVRGEPERVAVRALINGFAGRHRARRILLEILLAEGGSAELAKPVEEIAKMLGATGDSTVLAHGKPLTPTSLFVLTRAVIGVIHEATSEGSAFLGAPELKDELVRLIQGYLAKLRE